jgi:hypothetical protein
LEVVELVVAGQGVADPVEDLDGGRGGQLRVR